MDAHVTDLFRLDDRVALVTGGSRGLGREMVLAFADAGADVVVVSRKLDACERVAEEVRQATGRRAVALACNVSNWSEVDALVEQVYAQFEHVDVLVNNAGGSPLYGREVDVTEALWDKTIALNLKGAFRLSALVATRMAEGAGGSIINISTGGAIRPRPGFVPYAAAKAGMNAMTIAFAHAFGPKVRVNAILPGVFYTDIAQAWEPERREDGPQRSEALQRGAQPREIVGTALYLASDASSFTTGALVPVDGAPRR